jgi:hypothetical protein
MRAGCKDFCGPVDKPTRAVVFNFFWSCPDIISLQLFTPKVVGVEFKLYTVYNLHLK